jgi:transcriptional regulator with XRE-family HTH domain
MPPKPLQTPGGLIQLLRKQRGWSEEYLGKLVGTSQQQIHRIEKDEIEHSRYFTRIRRTLGITKEMIANYLTKGSEFVLMDLPLEDEPSLPLYPTLGRLNQNTWLRLQCSICKIIRPPMLKGHNSAYSLLMPDDSMAPEFRAGDTLLVQPSQPIQPGRSHVFSNPDLHFKVLRLVSVQDGHYVVKAHHGNNSGDACEGKLLTEEWPYVHLIVGSYMHYEP